LDTASDFYHYQIRGAVCCILKLYGRIDVDALLSKCERPYDFVVRKSKLPRESFMISLLIHGCIIDDDVGLGRQNNFFWLVISTLR